MAFPKTTDLGALNLALGNLQSLAFVFFQSKVAENCWGRLALMLERALQKFLTQRDCVQTVQGPEFF